MYINKLLLYSLMFGYTTSLNQNIEDNINVVNTTDNVLTKKKKKQLVLMDTTKLLFHAIREDLVSHMIKDNYQNKEVEWIHTYEYLVRHPKYSMGRRIYYLKIFCWHVNIKMFSSWLREIYLEENKHLLGLDSKRVKITGHVDEILNVIINTIALTEQEQSISRIINIIIIIIFICEFLRLLYFYIKICGNKPFCRMYLIKILKYQFLIFIILSILYFIYYRIYGTTLILITNHIFINLLDYIFIILLSYGYWFFATWKNNKIIKPSMDQIKMCEFTIKNNQLLIPKENEVLLINLQSVI